MANDTIIPLLEPLTTTAANLFNTFKVAVGGIFGLYLFLVILRWKEARDLKKLMVEVRDEIRQLGITVDKIEKTQEKKQSKVTNKP